MDNESLIEELIAQDVLRTPRIVDAFRAIDRADFVPAELKDEAYVNAPLPIGHGQTISQPLTVAFMLELLQLQPGDKILDVGSGSGWQTALLAHIVSSGGKKGRVIALERVPELCEQGKNNVAKYNYISKGIVDMSCHSAENGLPEEAPFDGIIAAASLQNIPYSWKRQLKKGSLLVAPVGTSITRLTKISESEFVEKEYPGFVFVPFVARL